MRKSLQATFQTAWDTLPGDLQRAFAALAVFNQGPSFHTVAMAAVLEAEEPDARALLHRLDGRSLLTPVGDGRWRLHPLLREFAAEKLPADDPAWGHMAAHYVEVARAADELYLRGGEDLLRGLALFDLEWPHIQAGQAWAAAHAETEDEATRLCSAYPGAAAYCLDLRLFPSEKIPWLEAAVEAARQLGDRKVEGSHLNRLGNAYRFLGKARKAIEYHQKALEIAREMGDKRAEEIRLRDLGKAYRHLGYFHKDIDYQQKALRIAQKIGDKRGEGYCLGSLGLAYANLREYHKAIEYHQEALKIAREIGDKRAEGDRLNNLAGAYRHLGKVHEAIKYSQEALKIAHEIGDKRGEGNRLGALGSAYRRLGDYHKAIEYYERALEIAREIGDRRGEGNRLANMGLAYKEMGNTAKARELWEEALCIFEEIEYHRAAKVREWLAELEA